MLSPLRPSLPALALCLSLTLSLAACESGIASGEGEPDGSWPYIGGDAGHTRYSPLRQVDATNFASLTEAWTFGDPAVGQMTARATPVYVDGKLLSVAGEKRYVVSIDPATGQTLWTFVEPPTFRAEYSMRKSYGKGVAYGEIDGRGVVYISTPAFFLHALDADRRQRRRRRRQLGRAGLQPDANRERPG